MQKTVRFSLALSALLLCTTARAGEEQSKWSEEVGAKSYPTNNQVLRANDFGANDNGLILSTRAIQAAIDSCASAGGGRVEFEPGVYLTGALYLKSNVELHIGEGVELKGMIGREEFPDIDTRVAGIEMRWPSAIINVIDQENVAVSGNGTLHAQGRYHWEQYWKLREEYTPKGLRWAADYDCKRVRTLLISGSRNVSVSDLTLKQAGFWTVHILYSSQVTVSGLTIQNNIDGHGPSTDGIDIDSSNRILVENCDIDCNDDNFCLKAGRDADGLRVNRPTEYVIIRNCIARRGGGLLSIGSETSGGIRNIEIHHLEAWGTLCGIRLKSALTRGGLIENIYVHHIKMNDVANPIDVSLNWNPSYSYASLPEGTHSLPQHWNVLLQPVEPAQKGIPVFRNVTLQNMKASGARTAINASGIDDSYLENFVLENIEIRAQKAGKISYTRNWLLKNVRILSRNKDNFIMNNNDNFVRE
ncbi:MAG TPA: glycoside hydrolase family 28 protein [Prolixibacteraceae bacterium]|nr:glycoside hydrolase family 28 protein [Prolixibacteraceae bacterium]